MVLAVPVTRSRLSHALTIRVGGRIVGAVHQFAPSQTRTIETEYDLDTNGVGLPRDIVPQNLEQREIRISRYDLYTKVMEEVFGSDEIVNLTDQYRPFALREVWAAPGGGALASVTGANLNVGFSPSAPGGIGFATATTIFDTNAAVTPSSVVQASVNAFAAGATPRQYEYVGCWFSSIGRTIDAKGDRLISVEASITYLSRRRVL